MQYTSRFALKKPFLSLLALALISLAVLLTGCNNRDAGNTNEPAQPPGVTDTEILIGSSLALSGHASFLGVQTLRGALSYINHVNENGGVHGRRIRLLALDDRYDPPHCLANTQRLIVDEEVFCLFSYVGTPTTLRIIPLVTKARIPLVGSFTGANALREPFNNYIINIRASYYQETAEAVRHMVEDLHLDKIAVFYQYDAYGFDGLMGTELALQRYGLAPVANGTYIRGSLDVEEGLSRILESDAQAVVMIGTYEPCAKFIHLAKKTGRDMLFYNVSFVGAEELARLLGPQGENVLVSQVAPPPDLSEAAQMLDCVSEHVALFDKNYPDDTPNSVSLEGYLNARVLVEGLERAGRDLTREGFIDSIETINDFRLGPETAISFSPTDHQGMDHVYFTVIQDGRLHLITDWSPLAEKYSRGG